MNKKSYFYINWLNQDPQILIKSTANPKKSMIHKNIIYMIVLTTILDIMLEWVV